jgi:hypothetical protein
MERSGLIDKVKINLDEYTPDGVSLPFDDYIGPVLDECATSLLKAAPLHLLTPSKIVITEVVYQNDKAYIPIPADYIRLYELKYPLWKVSVRQAISTENPEYSTQDNPFLKGGYGRPCVAIVTTAIGSGDITKYLECSKVLSDSEEANLVPLALYVKSAKPEELNDLLADALAWLCASKIFEIQAMINESKMAMEQATASISALNI